ncbi:MAG: PH domain-containing protein [Solirubrobacteraceae bacterium]|nr:PH domain-containing protein [Solirubrobacteraceae bacterium]
MTGPTTLPGDEQRTPLPDRVVTYWRVGSALVSIPVTLVIIGALVGGGAPVAVTIAVTALLVAGFLAEMLVVIPRRHALWWYSIGTEQIDLEHGWIVRRRTVVPMTRVQHVQLERGPLADRFSLAELKIFTAAGFVQIPALDRAEGDRIRQQIAELARIADDL